MTSRELRQSFLDFFKGHDHRIIASAPLKPTDETTLFTSAGMQPFQPWFRGIVPAEAPRVVSCQKCFRADDVEEVGLTPVHCTFFEMLGNFSFGDYFKREAIAYAWEYVTDVLALPPDRIWITVNPDDEESPGFWQEVTGVPVERIVHDPTNWWGPVGNSGPCGPCSEMYLDLGEEKGCEKPDCGPLCECSRMDEFWNLVFQMYNRTEAGNLEPLPDAGIDTGMGMERLTRLVQGVPTIFDTDLLAPIVSAVIAGARRMNEGLPDALDEDQQRATNIIAEHLRGLVFLLADGFTPSNEGAGYVLRRILRRAYRFGRKLGVEEPFLHELVSTVVADMGEVYPELRTGQRRVTTWVEQEERQFAETLERAEGPFYDAVRRAKDWPQQRLERHGLVWVMSGEDAFRLHDTYGLPIDIAREWAAEQQTAMPEESFKQMMDSQRQQARARANENFAFTGVAGYGRFAGKTSFLGYETCSAKDARVLGILVDGEEVPELSAGTEGEVVLDKTPFYAEGGGQVGDAGVLSGRGMDVVVTDTRRPPATATPTYDPASIIIHDVRVATGTLTTGSVVHARVDESRRQAIARAHTATHLLHHVLHSVLGDHAVQSGSLVDADRLRFDFAHFSALTAEQRRQVEEGVLALALRDAELTTPVMSLEEARSAGAIALFGEKYGDRVRVVQIGDYSKELCAGTHLSSASGIGGFALVSEGSIGAGLRRIEAVTGKEVQALAARHRELVTAAAESMKCSPEDVPERVSLLQSELRGAQREITRLQQKSAGALAGDLLAQAIDVGGVAVIAARVEGLGADALRGLADEIRNGLGSGIVVLGCEREGRVRFISGVSKDLVDSGYHAGNLVGAVARVAGGGGGGRPDFAQAGGKNPGRLDEALAEVKELVAAQKR
jgi:alanyl-tRNA synthetase